MNIKGNNPLLIGLAVIVILFLFGGGVTIFAIFGEEAIEKDPIPSKIAQLSSLDIDEVESYEDYRRTTDKFNDLITIINEQSGSNIPPLTLIDQDTWEKGSRIVEKYAPLIDNYNSLVISSKIFQSDKNQENYESVYNNVSSFSIEMTVISLAFTHQLAYDAVGKIWFSSGLNRVALKCPSCVSVGLSNAYWTLKTSLVAELSSIATKILDDLKELFNSGKIYLLEETKKETL